MNDNHDPDVLAMEMRARKVRAPQLLRAVESSVEMAAQEDEEKPVRYRQRLPMDTFHGSCAWSMALAYANILSQYCSHLKLEFDFDPLPDGLRVVALWHVHEVFG